MDSAIEIRTRREFCQNIVYQGSDQKIKIFVFILSWSQVT